MITLSIKSKDKSSLYLLIQNMNMWGQVTDTSKSLVQDEQQHRRVQSEGKSQSADLILKPENPEVPHRYLLVSSQKNEMEIQHMNLIKTAKTEEKNTQFPSVNYVKVTAKNLETTLGEVWLKSQSTQQKLFPKKTEQIC